MLPSIKSFAIAFAISILIFGIIGVTVTPMLKDMTEGFDQQSGETNDTSYPQQTVPSVDTPPKEDNTPAVDVQGESFTLLLVGSDYQPTVFDDYRVNISPDATAEDYVANGRHYSADTVLVVHVNKEAGHFVITALPKSTMVTSHGVKTTLGSAYESTDIDYFGQLVTSIISLPIDYSIEMQFNTFKKVIDIMYPTGIEYNVPCDMYYVNEEERIITPGSSDEIIYIYDEEGNVIEEILPGTPFTIDLKKGFSKLKGDQATQLLRYDLYPEGDTRKCEVAISFFKTVADNSFCDDGLAALTSAFKVIMESAEAKTDITEYDKNNIITMLRNYGKFTVKTFSIPGSYIQEDGVVYFKYTYSAVHNMFETYK